MALVAYEGLDYVTGVMAATIAAVFLALVMAAEPQTGLRDWQWAASGIVYVGFLGAHVTLLRDLPEGEDWVLLNASPDIRQQIIATTELHPTHAPRSSPVKSIILTGADVDAIAGLLTLRERQPLTVWATEYVLQVIRANPVGTAIRSPGASDTSTAVTTSRPAAPSVA